MSAVSFRAVSQEHKLTVSHTHTHHNNTQQGCCFIELATQYIHPHRKQSTVPLKSKWTKELDVLVARYNPTMGT